MSSDTGNDRVTEMGDISQRCSYQRNRRSSRCVIVNRASESRTTKRPVMADLRDSEF